MKLTETVYFSKKKYRETIANKGFSHTELAKEIYRKRAKKLMAKVHTGTGVAAAAVTGGGSLVAAAMSGRNVAVEKQKLALLEEEWARRGQPKLPKSKFKDKIIPITIAVGTSLFAVGIDVALSAASPDQFYQMVPDADLNGILISNYYTVVEKGVGAVGSAVVGQVVSRGRKASTSSNDNEYDSGEDTKYDSGEDEYDSDEKYNSESSGGGDSSEEEESYDNRYSRRRFV